MLTQSLGAAQRLTGGLLVCHPTLAWQLTDPTSPLAEASEMATATLGTLERTKSQKGEEKEGRRRVLAQPCFSAPTRYWVQCNGWGEEGGMISNTHLTFCIC